MNSGQPQQQTAPVGSPTAEQRARDALAAVRGGDTEAFAKIVALYQAQVMTLALALMREPGAAEELTQDAFVRAVVAEAGGQARAYRPDPLPTMAAATLAVGH